MLTAVPKPERAPRLLAKRASRLTRREALGRANAAKRKRDYGRRDDGESWPVFKARILNRDARRCQVPTCDTPYLGCTVHHIRHVGAGGKNDESNCITLCATHHDAEETGHLDRGYLRALLAAKYGYPMVGGLFDNEEHEFDTFDPRVSGVDGRAG